VHQQPYQRPEELPEQMGHGMYLLNPFQLKANHDVCSSARSSKLFLRFNSSLVGIGTTRLVPASPPNQCLPGMTMSRNILKPNRFEIKDGSTFAKSQTSCPPLHPVPMSLIPLLPLQSMPLILCPLWPQNLTPLMLRRFVFFVHLSDMY